MTTHERLIRGVVPLLESRPDSGTTSPLYKVCTDQVAEEGPQRSGEPTRPWTRRMSADGQGQPGRPNTFPWAPGASAWSR